MKKDSTTLTDSPRFTPTDIEPKGNASSPMDIIRRAQAEIEEQKEKLKSERADLALRIREIDQILGTTESTPAKRGRKPGTVAKVGRKAASGKRGKRGTSTKDIIITFLADGKEKGTKDIAAAVKSAGKSPLIGGVLAALVKAKAITNPSRGMYKLK